MTFELDSGKLWRHLHLHVLRQAGSVVTSFDPSLVDVALQFARRFTARAQDAEDVAQDALVKLLTHTGVEDPVAWLFVVIRRLGRGAGRRREPLPDKLGSFDPWKAVELDIDARRLLRRLKPRARTSFLLSLAGCSERETAARLNCSIKATEKALYQARQQVRHGLLNH